MVKWVLYVFWRWVILICIIDFRISRLSLQYGMRETGETNSFILNPSVGKLICLFEMDWTFHDIYFIRFCSIITKQLRNSLDGYRLWLKPNSMNFKKALICLTSAFFNKNIMYNVHNNIIFHFYLALYEHFKTIQKKIKTKITFIY